MHEKGAGHQEIFSDPQAIENSRQFLVHWTDILQNTVVGCPWEDSWSYSDIYILCCEAIFCYEI